MVRTSGCLRTWMPGVQVFNVKRESDNFNSFSIEFALDENLATVSVDSEERHQVRIVVLQLYLVLVFAVHIRNCVAATMRIVQIKH